MVNGFPLVYKHLILLGEVKKVFDCSYIQYQYSIQGKTTESCNRRDFREIDEFGKLANFRISKKNSCIVRSIPFESCTFSLFVGLIVLKN